MPSQHLAVCLNRFFSVRVLLGAFNKEKTLLRWTLWKSLTVPLSVCPRCPSSSLMAGYHFLATVSRTRTLFTTAGHQKPAPVVTSHQAHIWSCGWLRPPVMQLTSPAPHHNHSHNWSCQRDFAKLSLSTIFWEGPSRAFSLLKAPIWKC